MDAEPVVRGYVAAWNERDADARLRLLESACAHGLRYVDPEVEATGLEELSSVIADFQTEYPGHALRLDTAVDAHHDVVRFAWLVERHDGTTLARGMDACLRSADGRLTLVVGFFGSLGPD